jgi:hypothetical protein
MLKVFRLDYVDIDDNLTNWKAKKMLKEVVTKDLAPFQMYKFYSDFEIVDTNMWSNLSFEQSSNLIEHVANNNTQNEKSSIANSINVIIASRTKNRKK